MPAIFLLSLKPVEYFTSHIRSAFYSFRTSILFYPAIFSAGTFFLFLLTNTVDNSIDGTEVTIDIPVLGALIFAGSPDAARSTLSTIATAWATILGVAFSVTLIALQLSVTKHVTDLVSEFQNDRVNQLTLGWFTATVVFSLLVLKTVRVEEDGVRSAFTPILGVNIAVLLAIVALFILILFLHNVGSYIKASALIDRIVQRIISSVKKAEYRHVDKMAHHQDHNSLFAAASEKTIQTTSPREGILRSIDWKTMGKILSKEKGRRRNANENSRLPIPRLWIELVVEVGDYVQSNTTIANIHWLDQRNSDIQRHGGWESSEDRDHLEKVIEKAIIASIDIGETRDINTDPKYGLEMLRNIAIKAVDQLDIGTVNASVTGMYRILFYVMRTPEILGFPFMLPARHSKEGKDNVSEATAIINLTIKPHEQRIKKIAFTEMSVIYNAVQFSASLVSIPRHFAVEYIRLARYLLDEDRVDEFEELTRWYSERLAMHARLPDVQVLDDGEIRHRLVSLGKELAVKYPHAKDIFEVHTRSFLSTEA